MHGVEVLEVVPIQVEPNEHNSRYSAKRQGKGHLNTTKGPQGPERMFAKRATRNAQDGETSNTWSKCLSVTRFICVATYFRTSNAFDETTLSIFCSPYNSRSFRRPSPWLCQRSRRTHGCIPMNISARRAKLLHAVPSRRRLVPSVDVYDLAQWPRVALQAFKAKGDSGFFCTSTGT